MNFSNENVYKAIIEIQDRLIEKLNKWMLVLTLIAIISIGSVVAVNDHYQYQITHIKSELKVKNKQIDGLHKQLRRTQYQLKRSREQNVEQTARISELTNNGG